MIRLFHVTDGPPLTSLTPRPSPTGTPCEGAALVWAVDHAHLPNYLVPRDCPRVCWAASPELEGLLASRASRVVAVERAWLPALQNAHLTVHELDPIGFTCVDAGAGYWTSSATATATRVCQVDDCVAALEEHNIELRVAANLWALVDAVTAGDTEFSAIRMRNAAGRERS